MWNSHANHITQQTKRIPFYNWFDCDKHPSDKFHKQINSHAITQRKHTRRCEIEASHTLRVWTNTIRVISKLFILHTPTRLPNLHTVNTHCNLFTVNAHCNLFTVNMNQTDKPTDDNHSTMSQDNDESDEDGYDSLLSLASDEDEGSTDEEGANRGPSEDEDEDEDGESNASDSSFINDDSEDDSDNGNQDDNFSEAIMETEDETEVSGVDSDYEETDSDNDECSSESEDESESEDTIFNNETPQYTDPFAELLDDADGRVKTILRELNCIEPPNRFIRFDPLLNMTSEEGFQYIKNAYRESSEPSYYYSKGDTKGKHIINPKVRSFFQDNLTLEHYESLSISSRNFITNKMVMRISDTCQYTGIPNDGKNCTQCGYDGCEQAVSDMFSYTLQKTLHKDGCKPSQHLRLTTYCHTCVVKKIVHLRGNNRYTDLEEINIMYMYKAIVKIYSKRTEKIADLTPTISVQEEEQAVIKEIIANKEREEQQERKKVDAICSAPLPIFKHTILEQKTEMAKNALIAATKVKTELPASTSERDKALAILDEEIKKKVAKFSEIINLTTYSRRNYEHCRKTATNKHTIKKMGQYKEELDYYTKVRAEMDPLITQLKQQRDQLLEFKKRISTANSSNPQKKIKTK